MTTTTHPFLDPARLRADLYGRADRLAQRTSALGVAKTSGRPVAEVITELADGAVPNTVLDVGCGRGSTTTHLARAWSPDLLIGLDQSPALLTDARRRVGPRQRVRYVCADFHDLPVPAGSVDIVVAAFCLYHSTAPDRVVAEFRRCLRPGGLAILITKSTDSYRALDDLVAATGLDPQASSRPSLYQAFHSDNADTVAAQHLDVRHVVHHVHEFHFTDADYVARYMTTNPKYELPSESCERLTERFRTGARAVLGLATLGGQAEQGA